MDKRNIANNMHGFWSLITLPQLFCDAFADGNHPCSRVQCEMFTDLKDPALERCMGSVALRPCMVCHVLRIPLVEIAHTRGFVTGRGNQPNKYRVQIVGMVGPGRLPQSRSQHTDAKEVWKIEGEPGSRSGKNPKRHPRSPIHLGGGLWGHTTPGRTDDRDLKTIGSQHSCTTFDARIAIEDCDHQHHYGGRVIRRHWLGANAMSPIAPQPQEVS